MPQISIVIPVCNAENFLLETFGCVQNQTFTDFECVIVNDGSTDKSLEIINQYVIKDSRFKCLSIENSGCANIPRMIAIENSKGDLIFNLDADDLIDIDCIQKMYIRQCETDADIVLQTTVGFNSTNTEENWRLPPIGFDMNSLIAGKEACMLTIGSWQISCAGMLVKKALFQNTPTGMYMNSDEIASRYILHKAQNVAFCDTKYYYRNNNNSITRAVSPKVFDRLLTDEQLDNFISERYNINDEVYVRFRNTRFFNLIYLRADFYKYKSDFTASVKREIERNFKKVYWTQKLIKLREELPLIFRLLFLQNYFLFKISSLLYVKMKDRNGRKYNMK
jgi:glycosyltransferase involved in cell wall biosynthesis